MHCAQQLPDGLTDSRAEVSSMGIDHAPEHHICLPQAGSHRVQPQLLDRGATRAVRIGQKPRSVSAERQHGAQQVVRGSLEDDS